MGLSLSGIVGVGSTEGSETQSVGGSTGFAFVHTFHPVYSTHLTPPVLSVSFLSLFFSPGRYKVGKAVLSFLVRLSIETMDSIPLGSLLY